MTLIPEYFNLFDYFLGDDRLARFGRNTAIEFRGSRLTYAELRVEARYWHDQLASSSLSQGDRVALLLYDSPEFIAAFLGIAEAARDLVVQTVTSRRRGPNSRSVAEGPAIQHLIAEIEIDLAAARAMLARTATMADAFFSRHPAGTASLGELHELMKDFQCTKWFVNRKAIEIVDRALTASGGAGYLSTNPLARLYRDVRAGPFMQVFSPNEAFEYIGKVALGIDPRLSD